MKKRLTFCLALLLNMPYALAESRLTEIIVTAELLESSVLETPSSTSIIEQDAIRRRSAQHLEDLLNMAPNVNFATGASRGRFIQIRGIGERSEFQEPIINSVGVLLDGIDLTGIASAASTLDIQQVEVLRGPQGTLYGANALAGLINIVSNRPTEHFYGRISTTIEEYGGLQLGGVVSGPSSDKSAYRLAISHYQSDGFSEDLYLGRDDTNNIDETTARARYVSQLNTKLNVDFSLFLADINNGYDAFSLDNSRQTYSDKPGVDQQETVAGSVTAQYQLNDSIRMDALLSLASSDLSYRYDEDWSNLSICENTVCDSDLFGFDWFYSSTDDYQRSNNNTSLDLKLVSPNSDTPWVLGIYHRDQGIDLKRVYTFAERDFSSALDTRNTAIYGQADFQLSNAWTLSSGLRFERRGVRYSDSSGARAEPDENLWGGRLALQYKTDSGSYYYALVSRGYKPGGFNLDQSIAPAQRDFDTESMINYELGIKRSILNNQLQLQASVFLQDRDSIQTKQSIVTSIASGIVGGSCPCSFTDFTDNATSGTNKGLEFELFWAANERLNLFASLGVLDTEFDTFLTFEHLSADRDNGVPFDLIGREQAHAPSYQWMVGGDYAFSEHWTMSGSIEAKDEFFFSDRHDAKSDAYELLNLELAYQAENWRLALYGKNVSDELVKTRGFGSFGNDPRKFYQLEPYNQFAAPRVIGIKASMEF